MYKQSDISIGEKMLTIKDDSYVIQRIKSVAVVESSLTSHLVKAGVLAVIASSILWLIEPFQTPWGFTINAALVAFLMTFPVVLLLSYFRSRYQLRAEFEHQDEVGLQWITLAHGQTQQELALFKDIEHKLTPKLC